MEYKIIGYFEGNTVWTAQVQASDPHVAMFEASKGQAADLEIVCAIGEDGEITCPCEDSGTTASAETLYQNGAVVKWTTGGEDHECSLCEWIEGNSEIDSIGVIERMEAGERVIEGGGAQPLIECWMPCWMPEAHNAA